MNENYTKYVNYLESSGKSPKTISAYATYVKNMLEFFNWKDEAEITFDDLVDWKKTLSRFSSATTHLMVISVKSYFNYLVDSEKLNKNPAIKLEAGKVVNKEKPYMSREDIRALINASRTKRDYAVILTLCNTGLRFNEMANITLKQYRRMDNRHVVSVVGKGNKRREVFFNGETISAINDYLTTRNDDCEYLFTTYRRTQIDESALSQTLKVTARRAGLPYWKDMCTHACRAAFATSQSEAGMSLPDIQFKMGHESPSTTVNYIKRCDTRINNMMAQSAF